MSANLSFKFVAAEDCSVDPQYDLLSDGAPTGISVQDCRSYGGGFAVTEIGGEGDDVWFAHVAERKTLELAKARAELHFRVRDGK